MQNNINLKTLLGNTIKNRSFRRSLDYARDDVLGDFLCIENDVNYFTIYTINSRQTYFYLKVNKVMRFLHFTQLCFVSVEMTCRHSFFSKYLGVKYFILNNFLLSFEVYLPFTSSSKMKRSPLYVISTEMKWSGEISHFC